MGEKKVYDMASFIDTFMNAFLHHFNFENQLTPTNPNLLASASNVVTGARGQR
jgi:hypothetical protein